MISNKINTYIANTFTTPMNFNDL